MVISGMVVLKLLASKDEGATVKIQVLVYDDEDEGQGGGSTFDDGIERLDFDGDNLAGQSLHKGFAYLHADGE